MFCEFVKKANPLDKPWLIIGKGPSYDSYDRHKSVIDECITVGINQVGVLKSVFINSVVDIEVLNDFDVSRVLPEFLLMPWEPHKDMMPCGVKLDYLANENVVVKHFNDIGRLIWYNLFTGSSHNASDKYVVNGFCSGDIIFNLLAAAGVRKIRTIGIGGGHERAKAFDWINHRADGIGVFDDQINLIMKYVEEFGIDYAQLE